MSLFWPIYIIPYAWLRVTLPETNALRTLQENTTEPIHTDIYNRIQLVPGFDTCCEIPTSLSTSTAYVEVGPSTIDCHGCVLTYIPERRHSDSILQPKYVLGSQGGHHMALHEPREALPGGSPYAHCGSRGNDVLYSQCEVQSASQDAERRPCGVLEGDVCTARCTAIDTPRRRS